MIGQKWLRRNQLLDIDIEPSNKIYLYEELNNKLGSLKNNIRRHGSKMRIRRQ